MRYKTFLIILICLNLALCASPQKKIQKSREKNPQHQYNMGLFHINEGNIDEAIKYLNKALSLKPDYDHALTALGLAYSMKGDFQESIKYLKKSLSINPSLTEAHNYLGVAYQELGLLDEAEREFRIAIMDQNYTSRFLPYYNLARLCFTKNILDQAMEYINNAIELNRTFHMAHNLKGLILEKQLKYKEAIESYKKALKNLEQDVDISFNLGVAYFKNNEFSKAREIFEKIYQRVTDSNMKTQINKYLDIIKRTERVKKKTTP